MYRFFFSLLVILSFLKAEASHVPGGNITYQCVGPNTYVITLSVFEDCGTAFYSNAPETISVSSDCVPDFNISLSNIVFQQETSQICPSVINQSECNGGTIPGIYLHQWQDTITLPVYCDSWLFYFQDCCRNSSNNLVGTANNYYWQTILNSVTAPCNSSPIINAQPIPYFCVNQPVNYDFSITEIDGDSLHYSLIDAMTSPNQTAQYQAGYSGTSPINGIVLDPLTGIINFTPTITGNYVMNVLIEEFNANDSLVGSIMQDFQIQIINCNNINPTTPSSVINYSGNAALVGPFNLEACYGDSICFDLVFTDSPSDSIFISSNIDQVYPGATFSQDGYLSPVTVSFCYTASNQNTNYSNFTVNASDNNCPINGISSVSISTNILSSSDAGQDITLCQGDSVNLNAFGGSIFDWEVLNGDSSSIFNNASCLNCNDFYAHPFHSTTYKVTSNLSGSCFNIDTIQINVAPDFSYVISSSENVICINGEVQINTTNTPTGNYSYQWEPSLFLNNNTIANPIFSSTQTGQFDYELTVSNTQGCVKKDSVTIDVAPYFSPDIFISSSSPFQLYGDSVQLIVNSNSSSPANCGVNFNFSCNSPNNFDVGTYTGENTGTIYPAVFGNWYKNAKHQFLFTAAELNAAGFNGGKITELTWQTTSQNNATSAFDNFSIRMGCTSESSLNSFVSGLDIVKTASTLNVSLGFNTIIFTIPYDWDGVSNLIVEVCYDNLSLPYTRNWSTPHTTTSFSSVLYFRSDAVWACSNTNVPTPSFNRPVTRFTTCSPDANPNDLTYIWTPNQNISNDSIHDPFVSPDSTTTYSVVASVSNCSDSASYTVNVICDTCNFSIVDTVCNHYNFNNQIYTQSGIYYDTILNANGQNPVILDITITPPVNLTLFDSTCSSYNFNGQFLSQQGTYYDTISSQNTCDTNVTLNLVVIPNDTISQNITSCGSYFWPLTNTTYFQSGLFYGTTNNINGCDTVILLDLDISNNSGYTYNLEMCLGDTLTFGNQVFYFPGTYYDSLTASNGCDSLITYVVSNAQISTANYNFHMCFGDTLIFGNYIVTSPGIYLDTATGFNGCDSIATYNISLHPSPLVSILEANNNLTANISGGTPPYTYLWNTGETSFMISPLNNGTYTLIVTDANGCQSISSNYVVNFVNVNIQKLNEYDLIVFPNPTQNGITIDFQNYNGKIKSILFDLDGKVVLYEEENYIDLKHLSNGMYYLRISIGNEVYFRKVIKK